MTMARSHHNIKLMNDQRGGVAIWFALLLPVLLGFAALAVDLARLNLTKVQLQNAADAAALAGAASLTDAGGTPYNWSAAATKAQEFAKRNFADASQIQDGNVSIDTGYWNIPNSSYNASHTSTASGDVPAVHATISITGLKLFFAPIFNITEKDVIHASAIGVIAPPAGGTGMFPMAINSQMFNLFWNSGTNGPKLDPNTGQPYVVDISSVYSGNVTSGQWTSLLLDTNNVPDVRDLLDNVNTTTGANIKIGDKIWIEPGVKATLYDSVPTNIDVTVPVVDNVETHSEQTVVAIAAFHIDSSTKHGNKSYVEGHFIAKATFGTTNPGNGTGVAYGAYTPPILVQ
jgi:Flp pilus assembly protein TadG